MWKDSTARKIIPSRLPKADRRWVLRAGGAALVLALISAFIGFREGEPFITGSAKFLCFVFGAAFIVLSGLGYFVGRKLR